ncbi:MULTISPECIES: hypothetical protein [unclassified Tenacibaculum]|uniref:hypothetical protein n=1 Tax=unclassified Tenacibaculum TaxID=2635139 RepID=UPI001F2DF9A5|nr:MULTISPECIES: hypothetical protein [unclassified Tenacibaculum]MCF2873380.1 hypothetical protein [Tenacibaculum sp. Cn5-1]MCF2933536.1 hypothetical protein [Tenacibaculum sp. Cn5-34]MCG7509882.1 hypothetical protein [Tenacibaculum sp. Cn5-46]
MKKRHILFGLCITLALASCEDAIRDITGGTTPTPNPTPDPIAEVIPADINTDGFDFFEKMQGHWVGSNRVIADDYDWFAWDYRAISKSHIHGIHEGGSLGNLLTSFFVTNYKGKRTIMGRNGGLLSGIYRTSYFVLDKVEDRNSEGKYYRFVDAIGNKNIMSFELRFKNDSLYFNSYTSNLGSRIPTRHMTFKGKKMHMELAQAAASATNYPQNTIDDGLDFADGFKAENLYVKQGEQAATSATFLAQQANNNIYELAPQSGDPYQITDHPRLGTLTVNLTRNSQITDTNLLVYLSKDPLTDTNGYLTSNSAAFDTLLHFPSLENKEDTFLFTYLHPGEYYLTVIADKTGDGAPNQGDILSISKKITVAPLENKIENVTNIDVQN